MKTVETVCKRNKIDYKVAMIKSGVLRYEIEQCFYYLFEKTSEFHVEINWHDDTIMVYNRKDYEYSCSLWENVQKLNNMFYEMMAQKIKATEIVDIILKYATENNMKDAYDYIYA